MPSAKTISIPMPGGSVPLAVKSEEQLLVTATVTSPTATMKKVKMEGNSGSGGPSSVSTSGSPEMAANKMNGNFTTPDAIQRLAGHSHSHAHANSHGSHSHNAQTENIGEGIVTPSSVVNSKSNGASNNNKSNNAESGHQTSSAPASLTTSDGSKAALNPSAAAASASDGHFNNEASPSGNVKAEPSTNAQSQSHSHAQSQSQSQSQSHSKPGTRSTTPVPTQSSSASSKIKGSMMRTPLRSPKFNSGYTFNSDFPHFASPSIFLSPYVPSPPEALDKKGNNGGAEARHSGIMSSNFATDFGKNDLNDDTLNHVLPWLSPNAYGLFSPAGGLTASITPSAMKQPHTNFSLPLEGSSRNRVSKGGAGGMMICVSPLARKNGTYGHSNAARMKQPETPINFHEVFASPKSDYNRGVNPYESALSNEIPSITESSKEAKMVLEKPLSERSVKEDEDLNVLLDLAKTTPRRDMDAEGGEGTRVFRGAGGAFAYPAGQPVGPPSFLHLPMIGKNTSLKKAGGEQQQQQQAGKKAATSPKKKKTAAGQPPKTKLPLPGQMLHGPPQGYYPPPYMHPAASAAAAAAAGRTSFPYSYPAPHGHAPAPYMYPKTALPAGASTVKGLKKKLGSKTPKPPASTSGSAVKRPLLPSAAAVGTPQTKRVKKPSVKSTPIIKGRGPGKKKPPSGSAGADKQKSADAISAINTASGKKNDKAASLAAAVLRGVTMRPSGKWQAQLYFAGKSRYIGVFDSREKAALAYEIAREHLQNKASCNSKDTDGHVNAARKAAFEGVNEKDPRNES